jgi:hypothetical protein
MVQTTHPSDQKDDLIQFRHAARNAQSAARRRKGTKVLSSYQSKISHVLSLTTTQSRRDGDSKSPPLPPVNRFHQVLLYVNREGTIQVDGAATVPVEERRQILQAALPTYREVLARIKANASHMSFGTEQGAVRHDG